MKKLSFFIVFLAVQFVLSGIFLTSVEATLQQRAKGLSPYPITPQEVQRGIVRDRAIVTRLNTLGVAINVDNMLAARVARLARMEVNNIQRGDVEAVLILQGIPKRPLHDQYISTHYIEDVKLGGHRRTIALKFAGKGAKYYTSVIGAKYFQDANIPHRRIAGIWLAQNMRHSNTITGEYINRVGVLLRQGHLDLKKLSKEYVTDATRNVATHRRAARFFAAGNAEYYSAGYRNALNTVIHAPDSDNKMSAMRILAKTRIFDNSGTIDDSMRLALAGAQLLGAPRPLHVENLTYFYMKTKVKNATAAVADAFANKNAKFFNEKYFNAYSNPNATPIQKWVLLKLATLGAFNQENYAAGTALHTPHLGPNNALGQLQINKLNMPYINSYKTKPRATLYLAAMDEAFNAPLISVIAHVQKGWKARIGGAQRAPRPTPSMLVINLTHRFFEANILDPSENEEKELEAVFLSIHGPNRPAHNLHLVGLRGINTMQDYIAAIQHARR